MPLQPDSLIHDRYRILLELGHGGMGAVYKGWDENLGVEVAIKENLSVSPESERQFKREATLLASLRHPNLPRVTDHFVIPDQGQYLVMDFIPGEDARQLLERQQSPLPEADVVRWAREIVSALDYLHSRTPPVVHRDIKPGNIKITPEGRAVLVDFGLAKVHDVGQTTTVGAKALTPGFAPPEQYGMGRTDPRTDIYSLGATLYMLLANHVPADSLERAMGQKKLVPLRDLNPKLSPPVAKAIERALGVRPEDRFSYASEFAAALAAPATVTMPVGTAPTVAREADREAATVQRAEAAQPDLTLPARPRANRWLVPALVIILLGLGLGGGIGLLATGQLNFLFANSVATPPPSPIVSASETVPAVVLRPTETPTPGPTATPAPTGTPPPTEAPTITPTSPAPATPRGGGQGQIAFASERAGPPQVFVMNVDGTNVTQLTTQPEGACQPEWSPDGQRLLFISPCNGKHDNYPRATIYLMNADGSRVQPHITLVGSVFDPDWSTQGIAFTYLENNQPRIYVAREDGSSPQQISQPRSDDSQPTWSQGGEKLAFLNTSRAGGPTIMWMYKDGTFDGSSPNQVTRDVVATSPAWSPLGDLVAYVVNLQIWVVKWDAKGFGPSQLTTKGPNADPKWSPDGKWIVFESWRDAANHDIYVMNSAGGAQTRLTDHTAQDYQPAWRP